jgi:hypothetical protein
MKEGQLKVRGQGTGTRLVVYSIVIEETRPRELEREENVSAKTFARALTTAW